MQYYLFIDECGHHDLEKIDISFPCFAVCGILVSQYNYYDLDGRIKALKHKHWGHDKVILRSYNIRNGKKEFSIFDGKRKEFHEFIHDINTVIRESRFKIICPVIHKVQHKEKYGENAFGCYETALTFLIQKTIYCLGRQYTSTDKQLHIIFEKRGEPLDTQIKTHMDKLMEHGISYVPASVLKYYIKSISFEPKKANISGLQISDLMAYPILTTIQYPERENLSFEVLRHKLDHKDGIIDGYGIARFPKIE